MGKQWQDTYGDFSYSEQWPHWKGQGKQHAPWRGKGKDNASNSGRKQDKAGPSFPKYDGTEPKQILLVAEKKDEQDSIVKSMQKAVTTARKAEAKTRKIQEELAHKERCWASYQQDLRNTYKTEQQRFLQDSARLKEELAEALIQEKQAKAQLSASGDDPFDAMLQDPIRSSVMTPEKQAHSSRRRLDLDAASEEELRQALLAKMSKSGVAAEKALAPASIAARQTSSFATPRQESRTEGDSVASHLTTPEASVAAAYYGGPTPAAVKDPYMASPSQSLHGTGRTPPSRQAHLQRSADGSGRVPVKQAGKQPPVSRQVAAGETGGRPAIHSPSPTCRSQRRIGRGVKEHYSARPSANGTLHLPLQHFRRRRRVSGIVRFRTKGVDQEPLKRSSCSGLIQAVFSGLLATWQALCHCQCVEAWRNRDKLEELWPCFLGQMKQRGGWLQERSDAHTVTGHAPTALLTWLRGSGQSAYPDLEQRVVHALRNEKQRGGRVRERVVAHTVLGHVPSELREWLQRLFWLGQGGDTGFEQCVIHALRNEKQRGGRVRERVGAQTVLGHVPSELREWLQWRHWLRQGADTGFKHRVAHASRCKKQRGGRVRERILAQTVLGHVPSELQEWLQWLHWPSQVADRDLEQWVTHGLRNAKQRGGRVRERIVAQTVLGHVPSELHEGPLWLHKPGQRAHVGFEQRIAYGVGQKKQRGGRVRERIGAHTALGHVPTELQAALVSCDQTPSLQFCIVGVQCTWLLGVPFPNDAALTWKPAVSVGYLRKFNFSWFSVMVWGDPFISVHLSFVHSHYFYAEDGVSSIDYFHCVQHCLISDKYWRNASNLAFPGQDNFGGPSWFMNDGYSRGHCDEYPDRPFFEPGKRCVVALICEAIPMRSAGVSCDVMPPLQRQNLLPDAYGFPNSRLHSSCLSCDGMLVNSLTGFHLPGANRQLFSNGGAHRLLYCLLHDLHYKLDFFLTLWLHRLWDCVQSLGNWWQQAFVLLAAMVGKHLFQLLLFATQLKGGQRNVDNLLRGARTLCSGCPVDMAAGLSKFSPRMSQTRQARRMGFSVDFWLFLVLLCTMCSGVHAGAGSRHNVDSTGFRANRRARKLSTAIYNIRAACRSPDSPDTPLHL